MCTETFLRLPEEKRSRVLDAAWEEFTTVPFAEASINQIIRRAGIPRGSFYQYFTDKTDLFSYLLSTLRDHFVARYGELLAQVGGDPLGVQLAAFDYFSANRQRPTPQLDRCVRVLQINAGIDLEELLAKRLMEEQGMESIWERMDTSGLQCQDRTFVRQVVTMANMMLGSAIMDSLSHPERWDDNRRELAERLEIIKFGSLARRPA
jgi:AcrR family transcriptional regulator